MDRFNSLPRNQVLKELQTYKKYQGNTQKEISSQFSGIADLRLELYKLEKKTKKSKKVKSKKQTVDSSVEHGSETGPNINLPEDIIYNLILQSDPLTLMSLYETNPIYKKTLNNYNTLEALYEKYDIGQHETPFNLFMSYYSKQITKQSGLILDVIYIYKLIKNVTMEIAIKITAVLEYLMAEILELAGNIARDNDKDYIIKNNIQSAINNDEELSNVLNNIVISGDYKSFSKWIIKILKQVHPDTDIEPNAITLIDRYMYFLLIKFSKENGTFDAILLTLLKDSELYKHAVSEANRVYNKFLLYRSV